MQLGRVFLSCEGDIDSFRHVYLKSKGDEIFGVIIHEMDLGKDPETIEEWFKFIKSGREKIKTVGETITDYKEVL